MEKFKLSLPILALFGFMLVILFFDPLREKKLEPATEIMLPVGFSDLGAKMIANGTIDLNKLVDLYTQRGGIDSYDKLFIEDSANKIKLNKRNSSLVLNMFWGLGLANKNPVLDKGSINDPAIGATANYAATAGWSLAKSDPMEHFSKHELILLSANKQESLERIAKGIFRPCCDNSTYFPDCNHGMAMLGLIELLLANDVKEEDIYSLALAVNQIWFPDNYRLILNYSSGRKLTPMELLGPDFSSQSGFKKIQSQVEAGSSPSGNCAA